jgi:hypothetical protein
MGVMASDEPPGRLHGVELVTRYRAEVFPLSWRTSEIRASGAEADPAQVRRAVPILERELGRYAPVVLARHLKRIVLLGDLRFYESLPYGGTNSSDTVYLVVRAAREGFTDRFIAESLHHELSSILLRENPRTFDQASWLAANPAGFRYLGNGTDAVRMGVAGLRIDRKCMREGFLCEYAKASVEEDFNMVAQTIFCAPASFWADLPNYPLLHSKVLLAIRFYRTLDPRLDEAYFRMQS